MTTENAHSDAVEPAGFAIHLPDGFIELPTGEPDQQKLTGLASALAVRFGLPADAEIDQGLAETAAMLMALGASPSTRSRRGSPTPPRRRSSASR